MGPGDTAAQRKLVLLSPEQGCRVWFQGRRAPSAQTLSPRWGGQEEGLGGPASWLAACGGCHGGCQAPVYPSLPLTSH